jgi:hypothetical protein
MKFTFTNDQLAILASCEGGADVYGFADALFLRGLHQTRCGFVRIVKARYAPKNGAERQPYFGCILTRKGRDVLAILMRGGGGGSVPRSRRWAQPGDDESDLFMRAEEPS